MNVKGLFKVKLPDVNSPQPRFLLSPMFLYQFSKFNSTAGVLDNYVVTLPDNIPQKMRERK